MADLRKVRSGDDIDIKAETWNAFIDAAVFAKQSGAGSSGPKSASRQTSFVKVQNTSGVALARFAAVGVIGVVTEPSGTDETAQASVEFINNFCFTVNKPQDSHKGRWLVLIQPLANNEVGFAIAIGATVCKVNIQSAGDKGVDIEANQTIPKSSGNGAVQLLWVKGGVGSATATGEQLVVLRLGGGGAAELPLPQYQGMVIQGVSQNQLGADWVRASVLP